MCIIMMGVIDLVSLLRIGLPRLLAKSAFRTSGESTRTARRVSRKMTSRVHQMTLVCVDLGR
jgi:hypothetical protein